MTMAESLSLAPATLAAFAEDLLRARIFTEKYALRTDDGSPWERTPADLWRRGATGIARAEAPARQQEWAARFLWVLTDYRMVPDGRVLAAVGNPNRVTALNCYVVPAPHDSIRGIYQTACEPAETCKHGGGVGVDLSSLRPQGAPVANAACTSTAQRGCRTGTVGDMRWDAVLPPLPPRRSRRAPGLSPLYRVRVHRMLGRPRHGGISNASGRARP